MTNTKICIDFYQNHRSYVSNYYCPQTKFAKVMFLQVSVILSRRGVSMVAPGGVCMIAQGGMHGCFWRGGVHGFSDEIRSMSGWYASYWNAFLYNNVYFQLCESVKQPDACQLQLRTQGNRPCAAVRFNNRLATADNFFVQLKLI